MKSFRFLAAMSLLLWGLCPLRSPAEPPEPVREFRGAWVATVGNIDWPSRAGLPMAAQKAELRSIFDRASALKLNAIVLQVRPACDAFYDSPREPWSPYLTGTMGEYPGYDPLEFAVAEAHARGLELHAWFNPFRALSAASARTSSQHVSRQHPEWVRRYAGQLWLDPGEPAAREFSLGTILDVVRRYDVDGVHIDDYFYPYPNPAKTPFPDDATYQRYADRGGKLARDDWRRNNINEFVQELYQRIKAERRWVKFGISPFGIWRPHVPQSIEAGLDAYGDLYADSRRWLQEGWCDYFSPQLYWSIEPAKQSFPVLLDWWVAQNSRGRHLWPGLATERIGGSRPATEIVNQIVLTREADGSRGHLHWDSNALLGNRGRIATLLQAGAYGQFALVPASPWLGVKLPQKPTLERSAGRLSWRTADGVRPRWWLAQERTGKKWLSRLIPGSQMNGELPEGEEIALRGIDFSGLAGPVTSLTLR